MVADVLSDFSGFEVVVHVSVCPHGRVSSTVTCSVCTVGAYNFVFCSKNFFDCFNSCEQAKEMVMSRRHVACRSFTYTWETV